MCLLRPLASTTSDRPKILHYQPKAIGIKDLYAPDFGEAPDKLEENETPVFWSCGEVAMRAITGLKIPGITVSQLIIGFLYYEHGFRAYW